MPSKGKLKGMANGDELHAADQFSPGHSGIKRGIVRFAALFATHLTSSCVVGGAAQVCGEKGEHCDRHLSPRRAKFEQRNFVVCYVRSRATTHQISRGWQ
jgi:hypothetical protein